MRDLLECAWLGALEAVADPLEPLAWRAALAASMPGVTAAMSQDQLLAALRQQLVALGWQEGLAPGRRGSTCGRRRTPAGSPPT